MAAATGCSEALLESAGPTKKGFGIHAGYRREVGHHHLSLGHGPGLIQHDGVDLPRSL
jgi:hypothetical protein